MRAMKRWRYYCDHCRKVGGSRSAMEKHERGCTANPARICGVCAACEVEQPDLQAMRQAA